MGNQSKQDELPKHDIRPEVSQFIRNEMHVINKDIRESLRSDVKESKTQIINQNWKIFVLLISIFGAGNIVAVYKVYSVVQAKVEERIDKEFETERIRTVVEEKAKEYTEKKAQHYIAEKVDKSIKPFSDEVHSKFAELQQETTKASSRFNSYLKDTKEKYDKEYVVLANEVNTLKQRNRFTNLGDEAIQGNAKAFDELIAQGADDKPRPLQAIAQAESGRVKTYYLFTHRVYENEHLSQTYPDGTTKKDAEITTPILINILRGKIHDSRKDSAAWENRTLAAGFLATHREKGVPEALLESACNDSDLAVRKIAIESFSTLTSYHSFDVLECKWAKKWWEEHKAELEKTLKQGQTGLCKLPA